MLLIVILLISCGTTTGPAANKDAPTNLIAFSTVNDQIQLEWEDNSNVEIGFIIERKQADLEFAAIDTTSADAVEFLDTQVELENVYTYRVSALFNNDVSDFSNEVTIELTSISPTNLTAYSTANYEVILDWEDRCSEETGFVIERKTNDLEFVIIDTTSANTIEFPDENVETGNHYSYRVAALIADEISAWSNEVSIELAVWLNGLEFGTEQTLDIVTWNVQNFPKAGQTTVDYLTQAMLVIDAEVYALQEIESASYFNTLLEQLNLLDTENSWAGYRANSAAYDINLAYIYKESSIQMNDVYEIYENDWSAFPRSPLVMELSYLGHDIVIIANHLKAGGTGEDEARRLDACGKLDTYILQNLPDAEVVVLGDLNDSLTDPVSSNVFVDFLDKPDEYVFADMEIAQGPTAYWSYPSWPSHLDHILITNELFEELENANSGCETILVDEYLDGGWYEYDNHISDHRPVGLKLEL